MKPPEQVPDNASHSPSEFADFRSHTLEDKTSAFKYSDSTEENIRKSQEFTYGGEGAPEKM